MINSNKQFTFCKAIEAAKYGGAIGLFFGLLAMLGFGIVESVWAVGSAKAHATIISRVHIKPSDPKNPEDRYQYALKLDGDSKLEKTNEYHLVSTDNYEIGEAIAVRCATAGECKRDSFLSLWEKSVIIAAILILMSGMFWGIVIIARRFCR